MFMLVPDMNLTVSFPPAAPHRWQVRARQVGQDVPHHQPGGAYHLICRRHAFSKFQRCTLRHRRHYNAAPTHHSPA